MAKNTKDIEISKNNFFHFEGWIDSRNDRVKVTYLKLRVFTKKDKESKNKVFQYFNFALFSDEIRGDFKKIEDGEFVILEGHVGLGKGFSISLVVDKIRKEDMFDYYEVNKNNPVYKNHTFPAVKKVVEGYDKKDK